MRQATERAKDNAVDTAFKTTQNVVKNTAKAAQFMGDFVENTATETQRLIERTTDSTGRTLQAIAQNPILQATKRFFGADWLLAVLGEVDVDKIEAKVRLLEREYNKENPRQIAHRLIVNKAWQAGRVGLVTNIIPPIAVALLGVELAAMTKLQAEMIYEIAAAYGLDLREPSRRGEVLAIFGLSVGGNVFKGGLNFAEIIPGVGPVIGASSDAALIYALGLTACRFYESKNQPKESGKSWKTQAEEYWQSAYEQAKIMDRILVHIILASYPNKSWSEILPVLKQVSPSSIETVAEDLENPQPLPELLEKLSSNFAALLLSRCYIIARLDGVISEEEQQVIDTIQDYLIQNQQVSIGASKN